MAIILTRFIGQYESGNRIVLKESGARQWSYSVERISPPGFAIVNAGDGLSSKDAAQTAALNAITQIADPELKKGFFGTIAWRVIVPGTAGRRQNIERERLEVERERERRLTWLKTYVQIFTAFGAISVALLFYWQKPAARTGNFERELQSLQADATRSMREVQSLTEALKKQPANSDEQKSIAALRSEFEVLKQRVNDFDAAIGDDAPKRLAVVTLRKDVDTLREEHRTDLQAVRDEYNRLSNIIIGIFGLAVASGLVSTVVSFFRKDKTI